MRSKWEAVAIARAENRPPRKYYELTDSAEPMLRLARERFPSLTAVPGNRETVDQTP